MGRLCGVLKLLTLHRGKAIINLGHELFGNCFFLNSSVDLNFFQAFQRYFKKTTTLCDKILLMTAQINEI